ncbi:alpha,alpha-trehalase nth1 [Batrachochytrium dendrobatidis]|nr:alpha,alpha-trehalase nth1 [Batrachochytrium dendrobatidis]KAK5669412.1 alpha,alpha-trehalase nth1 [Batrachochytrium dendrobatidis]
MRVPSVRAKHIKRPHTLISHSSNSIHSKPSELINDQVKIEHTKNDTLPESSSFIETSIKQEYEDQSSIHALNNINYSSNVDSVVKMEHSSKDNSPAKWRELYHGIKAYRQDHVAPVDVVGCAMLGDKTDPKIYRYQTLTALQLSSQTKDAVTAGAIANLKSHEPGGLTVESILAMDHKTLDGYISKVGFHNRKALYMKQTAEILKTQYNSDIPDTLSGLMSLPGIGPKMAHLAMQEAWNQTVGIGVDTHVHRISHRIGWTKYLKTPEHSRKELEEWLPRQYWNEINKLLVGFGQTLCLPVGPKCTECPVSHLCPRIGVKTTSAMQNKLVQIQSPFFNDSPRPAKRTKTTDR